jgi:hypothetical protein
MCVNKLRKNLIFMWWSMLYSDIWISLSGNFSLSQNTEGPTDEREFLDVLGRLQCDSVGLGIHARCNKHMLLVHEYNEIWTYRTWGFTQDATSVNHQYDK